MIIGVDIDNTIARWPDETEDWDKLDILDLEPFENAQKVLNKWDEQGIKIVYVTFRSARFRVQTYKWLRENNFPNHYTVVFGNSFGFKSDVVRDFGAIGMIDDDEYVIGDCARQRQFAFLHVLSHTKLELIPNSPYILQWTTWDELDKMVLELKKYKKETSK